MLVYTAPEKVNPDLKPSVFLAGSIEMGKAVEWQKEVIEALKDTKCVVYNPRRKDWDPTWEQKKTNPSFYSQVTWEVSFILKADVVAFYLQPGTLSPISMFELGLVAKEKNKQIIVYCPDGFYRKGNIDIYSGLFNFVEVETMEEFITAIKLALNK